MNDEQRKARLLLRAAVVLFAVSLLFIFVPTRAGISYDRTRVVNCGSFFVSTDWGGDEGCQAAFLDRMVWAAGTLLLAVLLVIVAGVSRAVNRE